VDDPEASAKFFEEAFEMKRAARARAALHVGRHLQRRRAQEGDDTEKVGLYHFGIVGRRLDEAEKKVVRRRRISGGPADLGEIVLRGQVSEARTRFWCLTSPHGWAGAVEDVVPRRNPSAK
jgi:hypothetical protein